MSDVPTAKTPDASSVMDDKKPGMENEGDAVSSVGQGFTREHDDGLHRNLGSRQTQLITLGASIGTAIFVLIGTSLQRAGPLGLLLSYILYACILGLVNTCLAEMVIFMPVSGSYIRMASKWVDPAFGFMAGWNIYLFEACLIPFEISAISVVLKFWRDDIPTAAVCGACIVLYLFVAFFLFPLFI